MVFDYSKLLGRVIEKCGTRRNFANQMHLSERSVSLKLNNKVDFTQKEICLASSILDIPLKDIHTFFFADKV